MSKQLTILTPVYNRKDTIERLFRSLLAQSNMEFEWLIVDDGSSDGLGDVVALFDAPFPIRYIYKENGGKHTALNVGINHINSPLTFIVDSDDWLTDHAVETVLLTHNSYNDRPDLCGYAFLRQFPNGKINGKLFVPNYLIASYLQARINAHDTMADKAEVFRTACLKEFPFPEFAGERFLGEDTVWMRMSRKYAMVHINCAIYVGNYLADGLTHNRRRNNISSPQGCMARATEFLAADVHFVYRLKAALQMLVYGKFAGCGMLSFALHSQHKALLLPLVPAAYILYLDWRFRCRREN